MRLIILGSAAGGGFPQWNCNYDYSRAVRQGSKQFRSRTQSSLAASIDDQNWVLFNASPDIREQIANNPALQPDANGALRSTPIKAVILTNADVDHIAGLLSLREREPFAIYATQRVLEVLNSNSIFNVLAREYVERRLLPLNEKIAVLDHAGNPTGLEIEAFAVMGKVALFLEDEKQASAGFGTQEGDTIGLHITATGQAKEEAYYIPGCAGIDAKLKDRITGSKCLLFDGTVYTDDEMLTAGVGTKTGSRMGHIQISGATGSLAQLEQVPIQRRIYVHINNTNPILDESSKENEAVRMGGWEVGYDGMEIIL